MHRKKGSGKGKEKRYTKFEPKEEFDPLDRALGSKKDKHKRYENTKCSYCKKAKHSEKYCLKKAIDKIYRLLEKYHISLLEGTENQKTPREVWMNIESLFFKKDDLRGHIWENELISLQPNSFETIQQFFSNFKSLVM